MSVIVLRHDEILTLASTRRVIPSAEVGTLKSILEQAEILSSHLEGEQARIRKAESTAYDQGLESGFKAGRQEGLDAAAVELDSQRAELAASLIQAQQQAVQMAFGIVRKIASTLDPIDLLCALAITAARSCAPDEILVLRVHERYRQAVEEKLRRENSETVSLFRHIIGDSTVELSTCIIETQASRIVADMKTQAERLEQQIVNT